MQKDKYLKKHDKTEWVAKRDQPSGSPLATALNAECSTTSGPASVTLSHEDFQHLLRLAHGDSLQPTAAAACSGISNLRLSPNNVRLIDSGSRITRQVMHIFLLIFSF